MVTKEQCLAAMYNQYVYHIPTNKRFRVSGRCKTWKLKYPNSFILPIKFGLYRSSSITEHNAHEFAWSLPTKD